MRCEARACSTRAPGPTAAACAEAPAPRRAAGGNRAGAHSAHHTLRLRCTHLSTQRCMLQPDWHCESPGADCGDCFGWLVRWTARRRNERLARRWLPRRPQRAAPWSSRVGCSASRRASILVLLRQPAAACSLSHRITSGPLPCCGSGYAVSRDQRVSASEHRSHARGTVLRRPQPPEKRDSAVQNALRSIGFLGETRADGMLLCLASQVEAAEQASRGSEPRAARPGAARAPPARRSTAPSSSPSSTPSIFEL